MSPPGDEIYLLVIEKSRSGAIFYLFRDFLIMFVTTDMM